MPAKTVLIWTLIVSLTTSDLAMAQKPESWIRINQLGYPPDASKVAVLVSINTQNPTDFELIDISSSNVVFSNKVGKDFGDYGPFKSTYRLDFTNYHVPGTYYLKVGPTRSAEFKIAKDVYQGSADFALRYMRQQRSGYNPMLKDSCHTRDGYAIYGPMADKTFIPVSGGWHDASDYLQYSATSANATYHLLAAFRDFPSVFGDRHQANGLPGSNKTTDILDEARWGLDWLMKMHPREDWMFNQIADDRDHAGFHLPAEDSVDYGFGKGKGRPVYFVSGEVQGLGKYKNRTTGTSSTAGKFASAFALGSEVYRRRDPAFSKLLQGKSISAYRYGLVKPGVSQTAANRARYFYEEDNWVDDMELGAAALYKITGEKKYLDHANRYSDQEPVTPWMGKDTAAHYQWYPFHNFGHYELATSNNTPKEKLIGFYKTGIEKVWSKAKSNAFFRGIPYIWCSNNLTTSFAIQCFLYRKLSGDNTYIELEQACFDWLLGCNPWGTSMIYGLPMSGDSPTDPHSALTLLHHYPLDGGLVDGPVYGDIYKTLIGIHLREEDEYASFQSDLAVYHDDAGDYSTNEPTMDGTASLVYLLASKENESPHNLPSKRGIITDEHGAIVRGNISRKEIALVFTGDTYGEGADVILETLKHHEVKASFFLTGNFYATPAFHPLIREIKSQGHYLGAHSNKHLFYADWKKRDSTLVNRVEFRSDLQINYERMSRFGIKRQSAHYFLPPFEWYNGTIAQWTRELDLQLINFSPGTRSTADYTYPEMGERYLSSDAIYQSILQYESRNRYGLNGFILLLHIGTDPRRTDKFYNRLDTLMQELRQKGYQFVTVDRLLD